MLEHLNCGQDLACEKLEEGGGDGARQRFSAMAELLKLEDADRAVPDDSAGGGDLPMGNPVASMNVFSVHAYASSPFPPPCVCWRTVGQRQSTDDWPFG